MTQPNPSSQDKTDMEREAQVNRQLADMHPSSNTTKPCAYCQNMLERGYTESQTLIAHEQQTHTLPTGHIEAPDIKPNIVTSTPDIEASEPHQHKSQTMGDCICGAYWEIGAGWIEPDPQSAGTDDVIEPRPFYINKQTAKSIARDIPNKCPNCTSGANFVLSSTSTTGIGDNFELSHACGWSKDITDYGLW